MAHGMKRSRGEQWYQHPTILLAIALAVFVVTGIIRPDVFLTWGNLHSMMLQVSESGILSLGMMLSILIGGIDLSVSATAVLSATMTGFWFVFFSSRLPVGALIVLGVLISLGIGFLCGFINGMLIARLGLPAILATLGTSTLFLGLSTAVTKGSTVHGFPAPFLVFGNGNVAALPIPFVLLAVLYGCLSIVLNRSAFGQKIYLLGTNPKASLYSGLNIARITVTTFVAIALISACAGLVMMARTDSINPDYGTSYVFQTLLVVIVGGVSVFGGSGRISGVFASLVLLQVVSTSLDLLLRAYPGANFFKNFAWGALLLLLMVLDYYRQSRVRRA